MEGFKWLKRGGKFWAAGLPSSLVLFGLYWIATKVKLIDIANIMGGGWKTFITVLVILLVTFISTGYFDEKING